VVRPLGQRQQLAGFAGKAFLGEGGEFRQVVVGDQRLAAFGGFAGIDKLLPLLRRPEPGGCRRGQALDGYGVTSQGSQRSDESVGAGAGSSARS